MFRCLANGRGELQALVEPLSDPRN